MQKKRLAIYPYGKNAAPFARYSDLLEEFDLVSVISPEGARLAGQDASIVDKGGLLGRSIEQNLFQTLSHNNIDVLLILNAPEFYLEKTKLYNIAKGCLKRKIDVVACSQLFDEKATNRLSQISIQNGCSFQDLMQKDDAKEAPISKELQKISTPVVFVAGLTSGLHKFNVQLELKKHLQKKGYKILGIGTKEYSSLFGIYPYPFFMFSNDFSNKDKIIKFNGYVKDLEDKEKPDIIILGIPEYILPFSLKHPGNFGADAFLISMAVAPDNAVVCLPFTEINKEFIKNMNLLLKGKFGFQADSICLSNAVYNQQKSEINQRLDFEYCSYEKASEFIEENKNFSHNIYNVFVKSDMSHMAKNVIRSLSKN